MKPGDEVREGDPLLVLHHRDGAGLAAAVALCGETVIIGDAPPHPEITVLEEVR